MLPAMSPAAVLALSFAFACGKSATNQDKAGSTPAVGSEERIAPPSAKGAPEPSAAGVDDPRFHLQPEEGTITIDKGEAKAGAEATAALKLSPSTGYHVATDYPIKVTLEAPAGIKLAKAELTAGGRTKSQGDAQTLSEQGLAFAIKATPEKAGA